MPEESYKHKYSLILAIVGFVLFALWFILNATNNNFNLWPFISCIICGIYISLGGKTVAYKTITGVFSNITKKPVGYMKEGLNWADPIFETVTINPHGAPNTSAGLQEISIDIAETPLVQTKTRGIQIKIRKINFMLKFKDNGNVEELFRINGGTITIKERIIKFVYEFFLEKVGNTLPEDIDQNKSNTIRKFTNSLKEEVNNFCEDNQYPYEITTRVIIGDTELEAKYYEVLAKKEFSRLEADAKDVEANRLQTRIAKFGKTLLPGGTEKEQLDAALVALGIVKKDIQEKRYGVDPVLAQLANDIALYLKK